MTKILLVDDSTFSRRILREILRSAGHEVHESTDGLSALEQYFLLKPDLVILDLTMRDMGGLEVLVKLHSMDPEARIIIATADVQTSTRKMVSEAGALGFISKPFIAAEVLTIAQLALSKCPE